MYGLQPTHILIIILVGLLFFMPSRLPQLTRAIGQMIGEFRKGVKEEPQPTDEAKKAEPPTRSA